MSVRRLGLLCYLGLAVALSADSVCAQGPPPLHQGKVTLTFVSGVTPERTLRLSGEVRIRIEVVGLAPLLVETGETSADAHWKIEPEKPTQSLTDPAKNLETWRWELVFVPLQPGPSRLPVPGLSYHEGGKEERQNFTWKDPPELRVLTQIGKADIKAAHDITDIERPPINPPLTPPWLWIGVVAGVAALLGFSWLGLRRRRRVVALPPDQVALRELDRLAQQEPTTAAEVERHHRELARVLRHYLEQRFQLPAQRRTSIELANELRQATLLTEEQQTMLAEILNGCDLAKFAGITVTVADCQAIVTQARTLVEHTTTPTAPEKTESRVPGTPT